MTDVTGPEPLSECEQWIRHDHMKSEDYTLPSNRPICVECAVPWPCHYIAALDSLRAQLTAAEKEQQRLADGWTIAARQRDNAEDRASRAEGERDEYKAMAERLAHKGVTFQGHAADTLHWMEKCVAAEAALREIAECPNEGPFLRRIARAHFDQEERAVGMPLVKIASRCHADWQGPSDADCADDLLVIPCYSTTAHVIHHGTHPDTGEAVMWERGTADLLSAEDGRIVQRQFPYNQEDRK